MSSIRTTTLWKTRQVLLSSRPLSWINTAYPFAAAYIVTTGRVDALLVVGTLFFLIPYNLLMYGINDVFDYESDLRNPRKGGVEGAMLDPALHRTVLVSGIVTAVPVLGAMLVLAGTGHPVSWVVLAVSLFAVAAYSVPGLRFKERPVVDSVTSSTHFVSPAVYGLAVAGAQWTPGLVALLAAFFLWGMASHAFGAVQDVVPDREGGIASIATALGAGRTVRLAIGCWAAAGLLMLATGWPGLLAAVLAVPYIVAAWPFRSVSDARAETANAGWKRFLWLNFVSGFCVTMLLIVSSLL
ncbi:MULTISPECIES: prenyltransferase [unclassified Cryobacterium]|uniref:prenyltransferase n=1 Tax=unclassified Cryobacterium TaxID=2649013 RepID=UPI002AB3B650|nr:MULTISPECIES: prenyltransferase [unclassified Cryobacterium]MDY7527508.1 prenyltransferase [Cryobacterium sp. 10C2]MDY7556704.1 prenyltransferase [Cryobacterium sp. 10C3]MEB0004191.1 prenyltransferase [Cryobacterium sp. RTC2.1]MEB0289404.1 prenyltransferase [Cryobacterium sp. 10C2]